jgi:hypothetical protein
MGGQNSNLHSRYIYRHFKLLFPHLLCLILINITDILDLCHFNTREYNGEKSLRLSDKK